MPSTLANFQLGDTTNIQSNDFVVGYDTAVLGGERRWTVSTIANAVSGIIAPNFEKINATWSSRNASGQTDISFTDIPSWTKKITIAFDKVSLSSNGEALIQIGTFAGFDITNYQSVTVTNVDSTLTSNGAVNGFLFTQPDMSPLYELCGTVNITNVIGTNIWVSDFMLSTSQSGNVTIGGGSKTLSSTLDRIRVFAGTGVGTFDGGTINIICEG